MRLLLIAGVPLVTLLTIGGLVFFVALAAVLVDLLRQANADLGVHRPRSEAINTIDDGVLDDALVAAGRLQPLDQPAPRHARQEGRS